MKYPETTFSGQRVTICNRYIKKFRDEHNAHVSGVAFRALRNDLNDIMHADYHTKRLIWLHRKWGQVLVGDSDLGFPGVPEEDRVEATERMGAAIAALQDFIVYQRDEYTVTLKRLIVERNAAIDECMADDFHGNPTVAQLRANSLPSVNPSTNMAYLARLKAVDLDMSDEDKEFVSEALADVRTAAYIDDWWDNKLNLEDVRLTASMPEPEDPPVNLMGYIEVDTVDDRLAVTADKVVFTGLERIDTAYVYKDYGVDFFGDVTHLCRAKITSRTDSGLVAFNVLANQISQIKGIETAAGNYLCGLWSFPAGTQRLQLREYDAGVNNDVSSNLSLNTDYYPDITTAGTAATLDIYDDADRTSVVDNLAITMTAGVSYRYHFAISSYADGNIFPESGEAGDFDLGLPSDVGGSFLLMGAG